MALTPPLRDPHRWDGEPASVRRFLRLAEAGFPWHAIAGAAIDAALTDAKYGSVSAKAWLRGEGARWCELGLPARVNVESLLKGLR